MLPFAVLAPDFAERRIDVGLDRAAEGIERGEPSRFASQPDTEAGHRMAREEERIPVEQGICLFFTGYVSVSSMAAIAGFRYSAAAVTTVRFRRGE